MGGRRRAWGDFGLLCQSPAGPYGSDQTQQSGRSGDSACCDHQRLGLMLSPLSSSASSRVSLRCITGACASNTSILNPQFRTVLRRLSLGDRSFVFLDLREVRR